MAGGPWDVPPRHRTRASGTSPQLAHSWPCASHAPFSFSCPRSRATVSTMTDVTLSPEQERFAADVVASGRYRDLAEVVGAALEGLKTFEAQRAALLASVLAARDEAERDGYLSSDELIERVEAQIARSASVSA